MCISDTVNRKKTMHVSNMDQAPDFDRLRAVKNCVSKIRYEHRPTAVRRAEEHNHHQSVLAKSKSNCDSTV